VNLPNCNVVILLIFDLLAFHISSLGAVISFSRHCDCSMLVFVGIIINKSIVFILTSQPFVWCPLLVVLEFPCHIMLVVVVSLLWWGKCLENFQLFVLNVCVQVLYVCGLGNLINLCWCYPSSCSWRGWNISYREIWLTYVGVIHLLVHEGAGIFYIGKFD